MASFLRSTSARRDRRRLLIRAIWVLTFGLASLGGRAPLAAMALPVVDDRPPAGLTGRLQSIRSAFLNNSAEQTIRCFVRDRPVYVQVPPLIRGSLLGPASLEAFIRRLFSERVSVSFSVEDAPPLRTAATRAFVTAAWTYRSDASSTLHVDHLHLVLSQAPEHAEWLIVEMKTSRR